ncbi:hypothetical protein [Herbaspirillum sp.]|jgi:hypothetical protein|uniref:hypothetical protein n=1 Tax=Herbaspirillum sp. TaxID=1890675 RepID=UPI00257DE9EC|nr:hypothetical protein [Herbaspirillum sp.]|tara:strand:- start:35156 stop:35332 length:177 start_codon:yes stop_codon:yes gene_type:complete
MNSFNPLQSITNAIMAHVPDTIFGQGLAIGAGLLICIGAVLFIAALGVWIAEKMGYLK